MKIGTTAFMTRASLGLVSLLYSGTIYPASNQKLTISVSQFCPFMCIQGDQVGGFTVDLLKLIFPDKLTFQEFPWARGVAEANSGGVDGILAPAKAEAPNLIFPKLEIAWQEECFYKRRDSDWRYTDYTSFKHQKILVFRGWSFQKKLMAHFGSENYRVIFQDMNFDSRYMPRAIGMIRRARVNAFWQESSVFKYYAKHHPGKTDHLTSAGCIDKHALFIAFTPTKPLQSKNLAKQYDEGISKLKQSGAWSKVLSNYGL